MSRQNRFDPTRSNVCDETLTTWLRSPISGDLQDVPGIGPVAVSKMADVGVVNTFQLIGKYLCLKNGTVLEHQDAMYQWLVDIGINASRNNIIVALAEKCDIFMPGSCDISHVRSNGRED